MASRPELRRQVQRAIRRLQAIDHQLAKLSPRAETPDLRSEMAWTNQILSSITRELKKRGK